MPTHIKSHQTLGGILSANSQIGQMFDKVMGTKNIKGRNGVANPSGIRSLLRRGLLRRRAKS